jgi:hypothetical protein
MGFETEAHRMCVVQSKGKNRKGAPIVPGNDLPECSSLLIGRAKGNLPVGDGIAP